MPRGTFITFEGGEGSGKSTQLVLLEKSLSKAGIKAIATREPGGTPGAESIRNLVLTGHTERWDTMSETLLFQAARVEHVKQKIMPALDKGEWVLCDRFLDSTVVYQGISKGLGTSLIKSLHKLTLDDFTPDLTLLLDIAPEEGLKRAGSRAGDETRFEAMGLEFHQKIRDGFLALAKENAKRFAVISASQPIAQVHDAVIAVINAKMNLSLKP